jgi:nucleolar complex protein 2
MVKATKRQRKFAATGGVKGRLDKGTITKNGKLKKRKARLTSGPPTKKVTSAEGAKPRDRPDDFMGTANLGEMDMESFFSKAAESLEHTEEQLEDSEQVAADESESEDDCDDDDDDGSGEQAATKKSADANSDSDDSDSDDEDIEAAEARMKKEMEKMTNTDPDFYKYLKDNEKSLLEFGEETGSPDDDDDDVEMEEARPDKEKAAPVVAIQLTLKILKTMEKGAFQSHGIKSLKKIVGAYRSACHLADSSQEDEKQRPGESGTNYVIESPQVFDQLMVSCLNRCQHEFRFHLLGDEPEEEADNKAEEEEAEESKPVSPKTLEASPRWKDIQPILLSFFRSTLHVLTEAKEPELLTFILKALSKYIRYLTPFPRIAESMLKTLTALWSAPLDSSEDYQVVRLNAFFRIRQLALTQPFPFIEDCLKKTYLAYAKRAKFGNASSVTNSLPTLTFMGNCLVELYSLDYHSSYQHAFVYIRQIALYLRTAMQKKTKEAFQNVYCWQYIHCLKLWVAVLSAACPAEDSSMLRSLVYPLTEVIQGTVRLAPSPTRHLPMRLHCVRLLQQLAAAAEVFIPTTSLLLDCFEWKEWYLQPKKTKGGSARSLQLSLLLKLPKDDTLRTHEQMEAGMSEIFVLLQREVELYRYSAGFPEYSVRIAQRLRHFNKECRNTRWRTYARGCIDTCERYSTAAVQARSKLQEAPKDVIRLECLRTNSQPSMGERHEAAVDKEQKALEASRLLITESSKNDEDEEDKDEEEPQDTTSKKEKRKKAPKMHGEPVLASKEALEEEDKIQEGINWSDDEE